MVSTKSSGEMGEFYLSVYHSCSKKEITTHKVDSNLQPEEIAEEEEDAKLFDDKTKTILKLKANVVTFSNQEGVMGTARTAKKVSGDPNSTNDPDQSRLTDEGEGRKRKITRRATRKQTRNLTSPNKSQLEELKNAKTINMTQADGDKIFEDFLNKINITKDDYFMEKTTILNSFQAALRRAEDLVKEYKAKGKTKFEDPEFGPQEENDRAQGSMYFEDPLPGYPDPEDVSWCRPAEICEPEPPVFLKGGAESGDVLQGQIGDCWLIGAMSVLATHDVYLCGNFDPTPEAVLDIDDDEAKGMTTGLYCPIFHYLQEHGMYVIRFFKDYQWRYVIIDDRLPCFKNEGSPPQLVFGRCKNSQEFWVPIVEKAYAKLHNCYEALVAGYLDDGLNDMTGLVNRKVKVQGPKGFPGADVKDAESFWQIIKGYIRDQTMLGCSVQGGPGEVEHEVTIDGESKGILKNHAYSIIDVLELSNPQCQNAHKSHRLLRVRNPWGNTEWNGKWSDGSLKLMNNIMKLNAHIEELTKNKNEYEPFDPESNDGTFLMCFKDWREIYHNLFCCIDFPEEWSGIRIFDQWTEDSAGGTPMRPSEAALRNWATNPQYRIEVNNSKRSQCHLFISLGQRDGNTNYLKHSHRYFRSSNRRQQVPIQGKYSSSLLHVDEIGPK